MCSIALMTIRRPRPWAAATRATPITARLSASVPPPVTTTSPGRHPSPAAISSRASSSAVFARRATEWIPDGLP